MTERFGGRQVAFRALVGSHAYNLNTPASDEDWKIFVVPTFEDLYNNEMFSTGKESDDFDFSAHDIRQLSHLLWKANPNFMAVLFSPKFSANFEFIMWMLENKERLSMMHLRSFGFACLGMHKQKMGSLHKGTATTQPLVDKFGFDTKDAHHAYRCLLLAQRVTEGMSVEEAVWFEDGSLQRELLLGIKAGGLDEEDFRRLIDSWHIAWFDRVEKFFKAQEPDVEMRQELDRRTMQFVKEQMMK